MVMVAIVFSVLYAILLTSIFALIFRNTGPWPGYWIFFIMIFIFSFIAGQWSIPAGPSAWGFYWLPGLLTAVVIATLMAAVAEGDRAGKYRRAQNLKKNISSSSYYSHHDPESGGSPLYPGDEQETGVLLGGFFWILLVALAIIALIGVFT